MSNRQHAQKKIPLHFISFSVLNVTEVEVLTDVRKGEMFTICLNDTVVADGLRGKNIGQKIQNLL